MLTPVPRGNGAAGADGTCGPGRGLMMLTEQMLINSTSVAQYISS
jgi:hypothetical protein